MDLQPTTRTNEPPAAMEEFQEADVLWPPEPDHRSADDRCSQPQKRRGSSRQSHSHVDAARAPVGQASSPPVGIPEVRLIPATEQGSWSWARRQYCSADDGDAPTSSSSFVAPHEMVAARRRCGEGAERSVCVGHGRTLKGRDLRSVRTAVLRMTGFLET